MAGTLQFDLVSPERKLISAQVAEVRLPATEGDMSAMPGHAPTITTLRPGVLKVISAAGTEAFVVTGGFAEINGTSTAVLAERAVPVSELTAASVDALIAETLAGLSGSEIERASAASDLQAMKVAAGF